MTSKDTIFNTIQAHKINLLAFGVDKIGLFGSYIRNKHSSNSDIDILIDFLPEKETFDNYMAIYDYLENLFTDENVEIVTVNGLSPYIGPKILKEVSYV